jgi:hypothetical protein
MIRERWRTLLIVLYVGMVLGSVYELSQPLNAEVSRRGDVFGSASVEGTSVGSTTPLTYLGISPTGETLPTASSMAIQDNSTSGDVVYIKSTSTGNPVLLTIEQDGTNATGGPAMKIISDDTNVDPLEIYAGASRIFRFNRSGTFDIEADLQLNSGGTIKTSSDGNITLLPNGSGITIVGDAGSTSHTLNTNDDLFVSGKLEVDGPLYADSGIYIHQSTSPTQGVGCTSGGWPELRRGDVSEFSTLYFVGNSSEYGFRPAVYNGAGCVTKILTEEVTIPVGSGNTPVVTSSSNLAPANSIIKAVAVRVTQAPGGGATVVSVGRTNGGNTDEFIDDISTALGTTGNSVANNDGALAAEDMWNASVDTFDITTDADVTDSDMKIRISVWFDQVTAPTS